MKDCIQTYSDSDEWPREGQVGVISEYHRQDPVIHIELRKWADCLLIAPISANTLAKIFNGICDNLLTSVVRAWDFSKPIVVAPAMNTAMWNHPLTSEQLDKIASWGAVIVHPVSKTLACGDIGVGALASVEDILVKVKKCIGFVDGITPGRSFTHQARKMVSADSLPVKRLLQESEYSLKCRADGTFVVELDSGKSSKQFYPLYVIQDTATTIIKAVAFYHPVRQVLISASRNKMKEQLIEHILKRDIKTTRIFIHKSTD